MPMKRWRLSEYPTSSRFEPWPERKRYQSQSASRLKAQAYFPACFRCSHSLGQSAVSSKYRLERVKQLPSTNRLRHVIVHARLEASFAVSFHRVGCHRNDGHVLARLSFPERGSRPSPRGHPFPAFPHPSAQHQTCGMLMPRWPLCRYLPPRLSVHAFPSGPIASF